jgi:hypothetical protein
MKLGDGGKRCAFRRRTRCSKAFDIHVAVIIITMLVTRAVPDDSLYNFVVTAMVGTNNHLGRLGTVRAVDMFIAATGDGELIRSSAGASNRKDDRLLGDIMEQNKLSPERPCNHLIRQAQSYSSHIAMPVGWGTSGAGRQGSPARLVEV